MKIVSVINYKGGVGKTSLTANLAGELAWRKRKVLVIDLDPQASLTFSFITPDVWEKNFAPSKTVRRQNLLDKLALRLREDLVHLG
jgi:chromosome partitioning protein